MKNNKLGVAYNLFDGEELLLFSIKQIRKQVDYITVIWQKISNNGEKAEDNLENFLFDLKKQYLIDDYYCYEPILTKSAYFNEKAKRYCGLKKVKEANCSYFLSMDVDEFYDENEFIKAKEYIFKNDIKSSACSIIEYLKRPEYLIENGFLFNNNLGSKYCFYVPFIMNIDNIDVNQDNFDENEYFPVLADRTRILNGNLRFYLFPKHNLSMHHMSTIRKNLWKKYRNSTYNMGNNDTKKFIDKIREDILNFDFDKYKIHDNIALFRDLIIYKVPNKFNISFDVDNCREKNLEEKLSDIKYELTQKIIELDASNKTIEKLNNKLNNLTTELLNLQNSWSYRIAHLFIYPLEFYRFIRDYNLIKKSGLFDSKYYLSQNEDVKNAKMNPIKHYLKFGWKEGRNPSAKFNGNEYLAKRPDVRVAGFCPLVHYIKFRKDEK